MIFQPTYVYPARDLVDGAATIDATQANIFCAKINSLVPIAAYEILVYENNVASALEYDSGVITSSTALCTLPFYPYLSDGTEVLLKHSIPANTFTNGGTDAYKWVIKLWSSYSVGSPTDNCVTSVEHVFQCKLSPTLSIDDFPDTIDTIGYTWNATYTGSNLMWFRWILRHDGAIVDDTGTLYITSQLSYTYTSLTNNSDYTIQCIAKNQDGITVETYEIPFHVDYETIETSATASVSQVPGGGVRVDWGSLKDIVGTYKVGGSSATPTYIEDFPSEGLNGINNAGTIDFKGSENFNIEVDRNTVHVLNYLPLGNGNLYTYKDEEKQVTVVISNYIPALTPAEDLEPSTTLVPSAGGYTITSTFNTPSETYSTVIDVPAIGYSNIECYMDEDDVWNTRVVVDPPFASTIVLTEYDDTPSAGSTVGTEAEIIISAPAKIGYILQSSVVSDDIFMDTTGEPSWDKNTSFLAKFDNNLIAGNSLWGDGDIEGWLVRRTDVERGITKIVADIPVDYKYVIDYSACADTRYTYSVIATGGNTSSTPLISNEIIPELCGFVLYTTNGYPDQKQCYMANAIEFEYDVGDVSMGNNTTISKLVGYGRYYHVQKSSLNAFSGQLKALLGKIDSSGIYYDDVDMFDLVRELSTDINNMFLKDPRGHFWKVQVTSGITMTLQNNPIMPYSKQLEWAEVDDATTWRIIGW